MPQAYSWFRVVQATKDIPCSTKAVWDANRVLDQGDGCWATNKVLGNRLGLSPRTVEGARVWLQGRQLLERRQKGRYVYWLVRLPKACYPTSERPSETQILRLAMLLDGFIAEAARSAHDIRSAGPHAPASGSVGTPGLSPISNILAQYGDHHPPR